GVLAIGNSTNGAGELVLRGILDHVTEHAMADRFKDIRLIGMHRNDNHADVAVITDAAEHLQAVQAGEAEIQDEHVGRSILNELKSFDAITGFPRNLEFGAGSQQSFITLPHQRMVLRYEDPNPRATR